MTATLWTVLAVLAAIGLGVCLYVMYATPHGVPGLTALNPQFKSLDMRFFYRAKDVFACFRGVGMPGKQKLLRFWGLDFAFIFCLGAAMTVITHNSVALPMLKVVMQAVVVLRTLLDMTENVLLMRACAAYPTQCLMHTANIAGYVTAAKFIMLGLWLLGLFVSLGIRALQIG
ncbi:MAG: hypothetical protein RR065_00095 [Clostridia bacterium]